MSTWAQQKLNLLKQPAGKSWAEQKLASIAGPPAPPQIESPTGATSAEPPPGMISKVTEAPINETTLNPFVTAGKKMGSTLVNQMLPSMSVALQVATHEGLKAFDWLAQQTVGRIPGVDALNKAVPIPSLPDLQKKYLLQDAVAFAEDRRDVDIEFTKNLINSWSEVYDLPTAVNWGTGALAQLAPQVLGAVVTGGGSAMGQEVGSIYIDNLEQTAKENNMTIQQVVDNNLDEGAVSLMIGVPLGMVESFSAKSITGNMPSAAVKTFMNSPAGRIFRNKMAKAAVKVVSSTATEAGTEAFQTAGEHAGKVIRTNKGLDENIANVGKELTSPETIEDIKESARQGGFGGGGIRGISIASGAERQLNVPSGDLGNFSLNVLVPDDSKRGPRETPKTRVVQGDPNKLSAPVEEAPVPSVAKDAKGNVIEVKKQLIDTGLVDERTGQTAYIERTIDSSGITQEFSFNGQPLKADNVQEATQQALALSEADRKIIYPVTGKLLIQQAAQNQDGTVTYATGLNDANTRQPILITENPNAVGPQFSAYNGGIVGNSVEEVAAKIQEIGTPKVTVAQGQRANEIFAEEGVNKDTVYRVYKDVFGYSKEQAENMAKSVMNKIDKQIKETKANTTPTDLEKQQGSKRKPIEMTPEEVFAEMAQKEYKKRGQDVKPLIDAFRRAAGVTTPAPTAGGGAGKLGITPTPVAVEQTGGKPTSTSITGGKVSSPEKRTYAKGRKTKTGVNYDNMQDFIDDMGWGDSAYKELFDYLKDKGVKFEFKFNDGRNLGDNKKSVGHYNPVTNTIVVHNNTPLRTLGHEAMHAILYTSNAWNNVEFRDSLNAIRDNIRKAVKDPGFAHKHMKGLTSAQIDHYVDYTTRSGSTQEIVTHAFTHPEYANFLANIPASKNAKPGDTAWGRLKQIVLDYLGKTLNLDNTALDELNAVLDKYVGINTKANPTIETKTNPPAEPPAPAPTPAPAPAPEPAKPAPVKKEAPKKPAPKKPEPKKEAPKEKPKPKPDAVQKPKAKSVPVQPAPGDSKKVGKGVPESGKTTNEGKEKAKGQEIDSLPAVQRGAVKTAMGKKWNLDGIKRYGAKVHPIVQMSNKAGDLLYINQKGDVFNNLDSAMRKSLVEEKPTKKKKVTPVEKVTGDASKDQPAMKPATDRTKVEETPQQPATPPVEKVEKPPARKPAQQPSEDATATADLVVEVMKQQFEFLPKNMTKKELVDFIAALDEEGKPLGPKAYAIMDQMSKLGYIKDNGKKVDILFETEPGAVELGDPNVDYRGRSRDAANAAKAAAKTSVEGQAKKDMADAVREFINDLPEGVKNDLGALVKEVAAAFGVSVGVAKGLVNAAKSVTELTKGVTIGGTIDEFASAWAHGRVEALSALRAGLGMQVDRLSGIKPIDFVNPMSYIRAMATILSSGVSVLQAGVKMATGNLDAEFFAPRAKKFGDWVADRTKIGVTSHNVIIRNATRIMQGFYRGLTYTSTEVRSQSQLRGKRQEGALIAQQWMDELYKLIGRDQEMLARVHAVLDPEAYAKTQYSDVTYSSLNEAEKAVYSALRVNMDNLHNWSLKKGYINEETYLKFVNDQGEINYFGRAYQQFYDEHALGEDIGSAANALRADFTIYQHRKDFKEIKELNLERDPIYIAAQRMATALQNEAVTDYAESIYNNDKIPRFQNYEAYVKAGKPGGFSQLGKHGKGGVYGPLTGMYLPSYVVYDFKGFFLNNSLLNHGYSFIKGYDRLWFRKGMKELLTVYNPAVNIGNQTSNYTFAFVNGVDTFNFNKGLQVAEEAIKERNDLYKAVLSEGLLGTGISTEFAKRLPVRLEEQAAQNKKENKSAVGGIKEFARKNIEAKYGEIDDKAKISAYWVKTHVYGMTHDQAITEVAQGFQNYDSVGLYYDIGSKLPIIGNAFAKFTGDLVRIVGTSITHRPLATASYLAFIYALNEMTSAASDEDELEKEIRQNRPFQPKVPFIDMPLGFKFGTHEINLARLIAPFQTYDKGQGEMGIWSFTDFLPVRALVTSSGGRPAYMKFDDPLLGPLFSTINDKDFRGVSISDPKKLLGPETFSHAKNLNRAEYLFRSFGFLPATASDMYHIQTSGEDYYGRKKSEIDRLISIVIRVEEFGTPQAKQSVMREIQSRSFEIQGILKDNNTMYWHFKNEAARIAAKDLSPEQKAYQLNKNWDGFIEALGASGPRFKKAVDELYEPMNYLRALEQKEEKKK